MPTEKCIVCLGGPIAVSGGHVRKPNPFRKSGVSIILASFCRQCMNKRPPHDGKGCYGEWIPEYGITGQGKNNLTAVDRDRKNLVPLCWIC